MSPRVEGAAQEIEPIVRARRETSERDLLEQELETKLLTTRRVMATADGAAYCDQVVRLLDEIEEIESALTCANARPKGQAAHRCPINRCGFHSPAGDGGLLPSLS